MRRPASGALVWAALLALVAGAATLGAPPSRAAATAARPGPAARPRAPAGGPLLGAGAPQPATDEAAGSARTESDPLVANGLGSPSCLGGELAPAERASCETSGFVGAAAPTEDYGLDVHIDTGFLPVGHGELMTLVQDLVISPVWLALVWLVHALVAMLDWCFAIDLLEGGPLASAASGLAGEERAITVPLLALSLSLGAVLLAYHGLVRRRAAQSLGDAALAAAMVAGGLWLTADPGATIGALGRWTREASLGTLAAASEGDASRPGPALGRGLHGLYAAAIEGPWCYLEFGDVDWCRDPRRLVPALRRAAAGIAAREQREAGCDLGCAGRGRSLSASARLLREARSNGALFLALPANGPDRNSINDTGSLLRVLCGSDEATNCRGPGAEQAQFRTDGGTWPRLGGLLLIAVGVLGMLLMFGAIALRLLLAAVMALFLLLLAPAIVLVPALGERGRGLFRSWATRLFGAVVTKLVYAFLLGVSLMVTAVLEALGGVGWWSQWLLVSAFWWGAFLRRHELLAVPSAVAADVQRSAARHSLRREVTRFGARRLSHRLDERRERKQRQRAEQARLAAPAQLARPSSGGAPAGLPAPAPGASPARDDVALRARAGVEAGEARARLAERSVRVAQLDLAGAAAGSRGQTRRAALLAARREVLTQANERDERIVEAASVEEHSEARMRFLAEQARLPAAADRAAGGRRDYPALASLAGHTRLGYEQLPPGEQRTARLRIDRELSARREQIRRSSGGGAGPRPPVAAPHGEGAVRRRRRPSTPPGSANAAPHRERTSPVLDDARAVAEGRKRQLGIGRP